MSEVNGDTAQPLLLLGDTRRALLGKLLSTCVESWRQRWSTSHEPIHVTLVEDAEHALERAAHAGSCSIVASSASRGNILYLRAVPEALAGVLGATFSADAGSIDTSRGVAGELQLEILRSLCMAIAKAAGLDDVKLESRGGAVPVNKAGLRRYASATIAFGSCRARINLWLSAQLVELLAPPRKGQQLAADAVTARNLAITNERVQVEAVLGDVEVSLSELTRLSDGDVIVLDQPLASMGYLAMEGGQRVAKIVLGSAGAQRAISVTKQGSHEERTAAEPPRDRR